MRKIKFKICLGFYLVLVSMNLVFIGNFILKIRVVWKEFRYKEVVGKERL